LKRNKIIIINIIVRTAKRPLLTVIAGNCSDFNMYVTRAFGKFIKYTTIKLLFDNLNAVAKPVPTQKVPINHLNFCNRDTQYDTTRIITRKLLSRL